MSLIEQLGDDRWYVPLCIYITFFTFLFLLLPSIPFENNSFLQSSMDELDGMVDDTSMS